ncbi:serine/threonine-protein kinase [Nonomuraea sp. NPDC050643]|uniref:serine/threonine-protein kinase n=1 Tax=Nonomuraea sp. NPDC050643 TaxID=3155660 RepID=UPI0033EDFA89
MRPLLAGDPVVVGDYRITGRIGEGGQGVVYAGELPDGRRVAVKMLGAGLGDDDDSRTRFSQEVAYARRVKAFCTAQVLASGEAGGVPYVVSEYVDGPSLAQVIRERGTLRGAELRRLAIGTLTALAAIHRAGVVHRDFKPGNVLLSRDGPRVIDFGIARALEETELGGEFLVGTPPYMAPEQFAGQGAGPSADLFAWGSTIVAAAAGRPPFGSGELPAVINRILSGEPELGGLDGELRELVGRCLAKDPAARPTATQALLTLLGHRVPERLLLAEGQQAAAPPGTPTVPAPGWTTVPPVPPPAVVRRRGPVVAWAAAGVVVVVAAAVVSFLLLRPAPAPVPAPAPSAAPAPPTPRPGTLATASAAEVKVPDTKITLHENPADPVWVSSYVDRRGVNGDPSYIRDPKTGAFEFFGAWQEPITSPGGGYVASLPVTRVNQSGYETLVLRDRTTGKAGEIRTVDKPGTLFFPRWSGDGKRLLATVTENDKAVGFAIVDAAARSVTVTRAQGGEGAFMWSADGDALLQAGTEDAVRVLDLAGRPLRVLRGVGELVRVDASRTPLGAVFATKCDDKSANICFWDEKSGERKGIARLAKGVSFHGWLDERHFLATVPHGADAELVMMDPGGRTVRTLADGPAAQVREISLWFTRR